MAVGHLDSQRSLPVFDPAAGGLSSLAKKLRFTAEHRVAVLNAPDGGVARLRPGPGAITTQLEPSKTYDAVLLFVKNQDELRSLGAPAIRAAKPGGLLWTGYRPVAFVSVDDTWTAMRFKRAAH